MTTTLDDEGTAKLKVLHPDMVLWLIEKKGYELLEEKEQVFPALDVAVVPVAQ